MALRSAGLLLFRDGPTGTEVLLGHMGGPYWASKDDGAWSMPKGLVEPGEDDLSAARREFAEELGLPVPPGTPVPLGEGRIASGKVLVAFALHGDLDETAVRSNTFTLQWPPRSGRSIEVPEIDRASWFALDQAVAKVPKGQVAFLERLARTLGLGGIGPGPAEADPTPP